MRKSEQTSESELIAIAGQFAEFDQFIEFSAAWDIDFRQIGRGSLNATLQQAVGESWSFAKARFDRPAYQQGVAMPGMRTFAILDPDAPEIDWCGRLFSPDTMAVFAKDGEFQSISQPGFDVYTLSFTDEQLSAACERLGIPDVTERFSASGAILQMDRLQTSLLRQLVNSSLQALCEKGLQGSGWTGNDHIRDKVSEHLVMLLTDSSRLSRTPSQRLRSMAIRRAFEAIEDGLEKGVSVREVAKASRISRRTLEYAFRDRYGFSPKAFINSQRLVRVRQDLRSKPDNVPIVEIANHWGFWHMGQFARDYRHQFGELPSQTPGL
jgi:AraC-like DNA-binding protein